MNKALELLKTKVDIIVISEEHVPMYIWHENDGDIYIAQPKKSTTNVMKIIDKENVRELCLKAEYSMGEEGIRDYFIFSPEEFKIMNDNIKRLLIIDEL
jgi:hypothetical protein